MILLEKIKNAVLQFLFLFILSLLLHGCSQNLKSNQSKLPTVSSSDDKVSTTSIFNEPPDKTSTTTMLTTTTSTTSSSSSSTTSVASSSTTSIVASTTTNLSKNINFTIISEPQFMNSMRHSVEDENAVQVNQDILWYINDTYVSEVSVLNLSNTYLDEVTGCNYMIRAVFQDATGLNDLSASASKPNCDEGSPPDENGYRILKLNESSTGMNFKVMDSKGTPLNKEIKWFIDYDLRPNHQDTYNFNYSDLQYLPGCKHKVRALFVEYDFFIDLEAGVEKPNCDSDVDVTPSYEDPRYVWRDWSNSTGRGFQVLDSTGMPAMDGQITWSFNGIFLNSMGKNATASVDVGALGLYAGCKFEMSAYFRDERGKSVNLRRVFNNEMCGKNGSKPWLNKPVCPSIATHTGSVVKTWDELFPGYEFSETIHYTSGGVALKNNTVTAIKIDKNTKNIHGGSFVPNPNLEYDPAVRWEVQITPEACPGQMDDKYDGPCGGTSSISWVNSTISQYYPKRCSLDTGKTYYMNVRVHTPFQDGGRCIGLPGKSGDLGANTQIGFGECLMLPLGAPNNYNMW